MGSAVSAAPRGWSSSSGLGWPFTCSCDGVVWSHVCDPSCCYCVLGSCGVSVALFCRLGLLRALPCRVFACGFPWFRGPSSWCFLGLFTMVLSSRFRWLRMARGGCCLRFVQGPLPQAGAVLLACVSLGGCPSFSQVGPARSHWVPLLWTCCACGLSQFPPPHVFFWDVVTRWVNRVFLSLLIANEGLRCWLLLSVFATPFWWRIVVLLRPPSVGRRFLWLVAALLSGLSLTLASGLLRRLIFHLVRCFSSGACGFGQLPLPQVACLWILPLCLACLCASGLGWAATLPLCSQCFSCAGWPAGVHWVSSPCVWELSW